jgi:cytochrome c oxidase subunit 2
MDEARPIALRALVRQAVEGTQSVLAPGGPDAATLATLTWVLTIGAAIVFAIVLALIGIALVAEPARRRWLARDAMIVGAGGVVPVVVLTAVLVYGSTTTRALLDDGAPPVFTIEVTGEQWWWRVHYLDAESGPAFATANEIRLPAGATVELRLASADVIHSFWVPSLAGKLDMIPGHVNRLRLRTDGPGVFRGQCAEYCGGAHARMAFHVVVEPADAFAAWRAGQVATAVAPDDARTRRGRDAFVAGGCGACHTVRGTPAAGVIGPDLTHVGSRLALGAGTLPNRAAALAAVIASSQHVKPGNRMPNFDVFSEDDLLALAAYLEALR